MGRVVWAEPKPYRNRIRYTLAALLLALGAPLGLLVVRTLLAGGFDSRWLRQELDDGAWTYGYVAVSTLGAFAIFGYALGRQADRLLELSQTDALTGLGNVRFFRERLQLELARHARYRQPLSLLLLDLDGLKEINDSLGHRAGDAALVQLGAEIRAEARSTDACARWGGDEFAVLAPNTPQEAAALLAERIRSRTATRSHLTGVAVSIGVATVDAETTAPSAEDLVRRADRALYSAKRRGRNRVEVASLA
jgi:diguanylate cyclase (GGDEF)-like protein